MLFCRTKRFFPSSLGNLIRGFGFICQTFAVEKRIFIGKEIPLSAILTAIIQQQIVAFGKKVILPAVIQKRIFIGQQITPIAFLKQQFVR